MNVPYKFKILTMLVHLPEKLLTSTAKAPIKKSGDASEKFQN
jgi:hypothetical protein